MRRFVTMVGFVGLAACSSPSETSDAGAGAGAAAGSGGAALRWNAEDACSILSDKTVADALGMKVKAHELGPVSKRTDQLAGFSICYYDLENGERVAFMARQSPEPDNTPEAMQRARDEVAGGLGGVEDVSGLGRSAFWVPSVRQVVVFLGDDRYFNLTLPAKLNGKDLKTLALALAAKVD